MTAKIYFISVLLILQVRVFAGACEDEFNPPAKTSSTPTDLVKLVSVDGVNVDFLFNLRLDSLNFSNRVQNVFNREGFKYIGNIISYSKKDFLNFDNFGRNSLNELEAKLSGLGLHLKMDVGDWHHFTPAIKKEQLDLRLDSLNFTTRVQNVFNEIGFTYIGDIIAYSEKDFLSLDNFGRHSLNDLTAKLSELGLHLETDIGDWKPPVLEGKTRATESVSKNSVKEEAVSEPGKNGGGNKAIISTNVNENQPSKASHSSLNTDSQREEATSVSENHLIQIREVVFFTPEFKKWFDKKNNLHSNSKMKIMNIAERFETEGIDGLGVWWSHSGGRVFKLSIMSGSRGELRIYFTIKSDEIFFLLGEKASDSVSGKARHIKKAKQLLKKYFSS